MAHYTWCAPVALLRPFVIFDWYHVYIIPLVWTEEHQSLYLSFPWTSNSCDIREENPFNVEFFSVMGDYRSKLLLWTTLWLRYTFR